jgi:hypothetical protein
MMQSPPPKGEDMNKLKILVLVASLLWACTSAFADGINFTNQFGTATITTAGLISHGVELTGYNGKHSTFGHSLGTVQFSTGALTSGTVLGGGTFSSTGSVFDIFGNGQHGVPKGAIFTGAFSSPVTWALLSQHGQTYNFSLSGTIRGMMFNGRLVSGFTTQYVTLFKNQWLIDSKGTATLGGGHLVTPEPSSILLMGTGILALGGMVRRKLNGLG